LDREWTPVSCPHTWNDVDTFDNFGKGGHQGESDLWQGVAWYRKQFMLPQSASCKQIIIEFEGVRQVADVYLNGIHLGRNETGFIPFGFNLTPHLIKDGVNELRVRVDNTVDPHFEGDRPWNHQNWHPPHGGIYRNVRLHVLDAVHVTLPLYSNLQTQGVYAWTQHLSGNQAAGGDSGGNR
jgi:beta-galactosidase